MNMYKELKKYIDKTKKEGTLPTTVAGSGRGCLHKLDCNIKTTTLQAG